MAISNILKDIRVERNLIQEDLAEATGSYQPKMKEFSGATPVSVEQEFYINMLYSNQDNDKFPSPAMTMHNHR